MQALRLRGKSGADLVVVTVGYEPPLRKARKGEPPPKPVVLPTVTAGGETMPVQVLTLQSGNPPASKVRGNTITVGKQTFTWDGTKIVPKVFRDSE